jgi:acyl-CoA thioester hydrolase
MGQGGSTLTSETVIQVRWSDMDAMGHVNNATYLTYLETAREPWFAALGAAEEYLRFAMRRIEVDYLSQLTFDDGAVRVTVELDGVGATSVRTRERMTAESDGRLVVEAKAVIVRLDDSGTTSAPLPDDLRERLAAG